MNTAIGTQWSLWHSGYRRRRCCTLMMITLTRFVWYVWDNRLVLFIPMQSLMCICFVGSSFIWRGHQDADQNHSRQGGPLTTSFLQMQNLVKCHGICTCQFTQKCVMCKKRCIKNATSLCLETLAKGHTDSSWQKGCLVTQITTLYIGGEHESILHDKPWGGSAAPDGDHISIYSLLLDQIRNLRLQYAWD